jgi:sugar O-acyltransferase (sialic acid O-acetyltransferase NeuD family)
VKDLYLIGGGGHCVSCIDVIESEGKYKIKGIFDRPERVGEKILGYSILGSDQDLKSYVNPKASFLITVGQIKSSEPRMRIFQNLVDLNAEFATIISPRAYVSKHASLGRGTIVLHDSLVNANVKVGENCILNSKSLIEHDSIIEDHTHISTAAVVNGGCRVEKGSFVGSNSVLKEGLVVKALSVLKAGEFHR